MHGTQCQLRGPQLTEQVFFRVRRLVLASPSHKALVSSLPEHPADPVAGACRGHSTLEAARKQGQLTGRDSNTGQTSGPHSVCAFLCRSAPLPVKVDGFSVGAVVGFSEQHTVICLSTQEEITSFKQVRGPLPPQPHLQGSQAEARPGPQTGAGARKAVSSCKQQLRDLADQQCVTSSVWPACVRDLDRTSVL